MSIVYDQNNPSQHPRDQIHNQFMKGINSNTTNQNKTIIDEAKDIKPANKISVSSRTTKHQKLQNKSLPNQTAAESLNVEENKHLGVTGHYDRANKVEIMITLPECRSESENEIAQSSGSERSSKKTRKEQKLGKITVSEVDELMLALYQREETDQVGYLTTPKM